MLGKSYAETHAHLIGTKVGRLTVLSYGHPDVVRKEHVWACLCDCGREVMARTKRLQRGNPMCPECQSANSSHRHKRHGQAVIRTPEYRIWRGIRTRCLNSNDKGFHRYGGRGIKMCDRWVAQFENFLADMGKRPSPIHSIDRIDNDLGYSKENCRWALPKEQSRNTRTNFMVTAFGETKCVTEWVEQMGLSRSSIARRIKKGMPPEQALTMPRRQGHRRDLLDGVTHDGLPAWVGRAEA